MPDEVTAMWIARMSYGWEWGVEGGGMKATGCSDGLIRALSKIQDEVLFRYRDEPGRTLAQSDGSGAGGSMGE